jgi:hypothetical protein
MKYKIPFFEILIAVAIATANWGNGNTIERPATATVATTDAHLGQVVPTLNKGCDPGVPPKR